MSLAALSRNTLNVVSKPTGIACPRSLGVPREVPKKSPKDACMYPPLDVPKPIADGVWVVDSGPMEVFGIPLPIRMTVLRLADGGLWLHSPTRLTPALAAALQALGPI